MLHNPFDYLQYDFGVKGVLSALLAGITCSALGTSIVLRKMAFAGAGISHVAFAGVALGFLLGISPIFSALLLSLLVSVVLWYFQVKKGLHFDVTMGVLFSASMGLAVIALSLSGAYGSQALSYLFGSPLLVSGIDIAMLLLSFIAVSLFFSFFWRDIYLVTFSSEIAKASGYKVELITFLLNLLVGAVVALSIKAVGALLVFSLLVVPSAAAYRVSKSYGRFFFLSVFFGIVSSLGGIFLSFALDAPSGATITVVSFLLFLLTSILG